MLVPSGITLCQPQSIAYCTDGSKKLLEANFSMVSMPSSLTSALSSYNQTPLMMKHLSCFSSKLYKICFDFSCFILIFILKVHSHLLKKTLPHLLYIKGLFFQYKFHYGGHEAGLRKGTVNTVFQPPVLLDMGHSV